MNLNIDEAAPFPENREPLSVDQERRAQLRMDDDGCPNFPYARGDDPSTTVLDNGSCDQECHQ